MIPRKYRVTFVATGAHRDFPQRAAANGFAMIQRAQGHNVKVAPVFE
jgi:hypothetical protein